MRAFHVLLLLASLLGWTTAQAAHTQARLVLASNTVRPGDTVMAGIHLKMAKGWHTYWHYEGDAGAPTKVEWSLPTGISAAEILWPVPEKSVDADLTTYVYEDEVVLLVPMTLAKDVPSGPQKLAAKVSWLECEKICLPASAQVEATLMVGDATGSSPENSLIATWKQKLPRKPDGLAQLRASWESPANGESRPLIIECKLGGNLSELDFFPIPDDHQYQMAGDAIPIPNATGLLRLRKTVKKTGDNWPAQLAGILVVKPGSDPSPLAYEISTPIASHPVTAVVASGNAPSPTVLNGNAPSPSLWGMFGFAFLGGLILNIMPCVLPVVALKVLGFVNQSKESPGEVRKLGLIYGLGVLVSFLALATMVIAVQQAGHAANWGMQFQNPRFLIAMTILISLVALNLFGIFEITLSGRAMGVAGEYASKEGPAGAFFNGVLATALATPCTAPFLSLALGFAFAQSPVVIVLMFLVIGLGLALPYVLLSFAPALSRFMPKPGLWMQKFKVAMGFPMLATAVWLFTLSVAHFEGGVLWLGLFLVMLAAAVWVWGEFVQRGRRHRGLAMAVSIFLVAGGYFYGLEGELHWRSPAQIQGNQIVRNDPNGIQWQPWNPGAVQTGQSEGRLVFVDFTADWCVTCQANKKTSIEIPSVRAKLKEINALSLLGDYTREDPRITSELKRFARAGVPLVVVFPPGADASPIVLPEILTPSIVLNALDKAAPKAQSGSLLSRDSR